MRFSSLVAVQFLVLTRCTRTVVHVYAYRVSGSRLRFCTVIHCVPLYLLVGFYPHVYTCISFTLVIPRLVGYTAVLLRYVHTLRGCRLVARSGLRSYTAFYGCGWLPAVGLHVTGYGSLHVFLPPFTFAHRSLLPLRFGYALRLLRFCCIAFTTLPVRVGWLPNVTL